MFIKILGYGIIGFLLIHGLIHLIGFRVYGQGVQLAEMPFKTTFLNGRLNLGLTLTRLYGMLWLLPAIGFVAAAVGLALHAGWSQPVLVIASLVSIVLTAIDWGNAFRGTLIDLGLLVVVLSAPLAARFGPTA